MPDWLLIAIYTGFVLTVLAVGIWAIKEWVAAGRRRDRDLAAVWNELARDPHPWVEGERLGLVAELENVIEAAKNGEVEGLRYEDRDDPPYYDQMAYWRGYKVDWDASRYFYVWRGDDDIIAGQSARHPSEISWRDKAIPEDKAAFRELFDLVAEARRPKPCPEIVPKSEFRATDEKRGTVPGEW